MGYRHIVIFHFKPVIGFVSRILNVCESL